MFYSSENKTTEKKQSHRPKRFKPKLIVLGASTGGVDALVHVLTGIGPNCPPIVVLQHINLYFSKPFVTRIANLANLKVSSCQQNEVVHPGHIYSPTGNYNISLEERDGKIVINRNKNQIADHWPLIDYTFESISYLSIPKAAILLTGMGSDGAIGMKKIHNTDSYCMVQDQQSSVVYGMPKIAKQLGAYDYIGDLDQIRSKLLGMI
ncbi:MAG: CheB methylesterase domain-containing protein [Oligoflexales bacterium]